MQSVTESAKNPKQEEQQAPAKGPKATPSAVAQKEEDDEEEEEEEKGKSDDADEQQGPRRHRDGPKRFMFTKNKLRFILHRFAVHAFVALRIMTERRNQGLRADGFPLSEKEIRLRNSVSQTKPQDPGLAGEIAKVAAEMEQRLQTYKRTQIEPINEKDIQKLVSGVAFEAAENFDDLTHLYNHYVGLEGCDYDWSDDS